MRVLRRAGHLVLERERGHTELFDTPGFRNDEGRREPVGRSAVPETGSSMWTAFLYPPVRCFHQHYRNDSYENRKYRVWTGDSDL